jgi:hypothetical protein
LGNPKWRTQQLIFEQSAHDPEKVDVIMTGFAFKNLNLSKYIKAVRFS